MSHADFMSSPHNINYLKTTSVQSQTEKSQIIDLILCASGDHMSTPNILTRSHFTPEYSNNSILHKCYLEISGRAVKWPEIIRIIKWKRKQNKWKNHCFKNWTEHLFEPEGLSFIPDFVQSKIHFADLVRKFVGPAINSSLIQSDSWFETEKLRQKIKLNCFACHVIKGCLTQ